jgi:hypothetical protein
MAGDLQAGGSRAEAVQGAGAPGGRQGGDALSLLKFIRANTGTPQQSAFDLLMAHLSKEQRASYTSRGIICENIRPSFFRRRRSYILLNNGEIYSSPMQLSTPLPKAIRVISRFCIFPRIPGTKRTHDWSIPTEDKLLACLLLIRHNERAFRWMAGKWPAYATGSAEEAGLFR